MTSLPYDVHDEALARATWSRLVEPADAAAAALVGHLGAGPALEWLLSEGLTSEGEARTSPRPPLPSCHDAAVASARWAQAVGRWAPRLSGLDIRRELDVLERLGGSLLTPGDPWWPPGLGELAQPPMCLWVRGDPALLVSAQDQDLLEGASQPQEGQGTGGESDEEDAGGPADQESPDEDPPEERTVEQEAPEELPRGWGLPDRPPTREDRVPHGVATGYCLAVVGARASTAYGEEVATELAGGLAAAGCVVVSGGAYGIDAAVHRGALARGRTVSVSAGGVDRLYPGGNTALLEAVIRQGALVAEVPPGCSPARHRFLSRNRLIAAMTQATVVVEAAWRSGALSTARCAQDLGRPLGAVPGPVTSMASVGCHRILRAGAVLVTDVDEVLELLLPVGTQDADARKEAQPRNQGQGLLDGLDGDAALVMDALPARRSAGVESVARSAGLSVPQVLAALGLLELSGRVQQEGERWRRKVSA
ncbi:DNA-processing protein DprA [uncultured Actinomyces sp.]|uniref:DNA-processing protein DprA n=1 Tax=uncultured Actinomyces sp. TaxID=249061 RepID=UPI0028EDE2D0|nr:DNA-processing protein DprA [uncultured Actinomyces sp.]